MKTQVVVSLLIAVLACQLALAQPHQHDHADHAAGSTPIAPPKIFLDKSPRIVWYQLNRLDNQRLLLVERQTDDPKYAPVYTAILTRAGMSPQYREEALEALITLNHSSAAAELLTAMANIDAGDRQQRRTGRALATMLLRLSEQELAANEEAFQAATQSDNQLLRGVGYAGLIVGGQSDAAWQRASIGTSNTIDWLAAVPLVPSAPQRAALRDAVVPLLDDSHPQAVRRAAIDTLASVPSRQSESFRLVAPLVSDARLRTNAIRTLLQIPPKDRDAKTSAELVDFLVKHAESTPAAKRTTDPFIDAMLLADQLLARIPVNAARSYRQRLRAVTVRVVRIHTVEEEMRFDTPYFAVEAGRPVQIVLKNEDIMPHNLVVTVPGALREVAEAGAVHGPKPGFEDKPYVPISDKVLYATGMVQSGRQERLTFTAPSEAGEYPYVCTFPRHWMRMYGVMVVVPDLDAWLQDPTEPTDPTGNNRSFVQAWTFDDIKHDLSAGMRGRSAQIGQRLFQEATCAQCHKVRGQGGAVGPELTDVFKRFKGDRADVLREILDPSHRIDPKYAVHLIVTIDGQTFSGIVQADDTKSVSLLANPEAKEPTVIQRSDIDEMIKTSTSMMPKALLDRFTKDEIFELLAFLEAIAVPSSDTDSAGR